MTDTNVVFLAFRNETPTVVEEILACKNCSNKTWTAIYRGGEAENFPQLQCAACGQVAGKFGWVDGGACAPRADRFTRSKKARLLRAFSMALPKIVPPLILRKPPV